MNDIAQIRPGQLFKEMSLYDFQELQLKNVIDVCFEYMSLGITSEKCVRIFLGIR